MKQQKPLFIFCSILSIFLFSACNHPNSPTFSPTTNTSNSSTGTATTLQANSVQTKGATIYYGVHVPGQMNALTNLTTFEGIAKKPAAIAMWYQGWGVTDGSQNFENAWMDGVRAHGSIPMVDWEPYLYSAGVNQGNYSLANIIQGNFDTYITNWAQASKAWGHPYFLIFAEEMNGYWFPWAEQVNGNSGGQYVQAWRHVHDIFTKVGASNVTWVWSPNVDYKGATPLSGLYPGDNYVDWVSMDGYNFGPQQNHKWEDFTTTFQQTYNTLTGLTSKPLMIGEMASTEQGGNKASWITDAYSMQTLQNFPKVKAIIWHDEVSNGMDWPIETSMAAQSAFAAAIQNSSFASNSFSNLTASPIPTL